MKDLKILIPYIINSCNRASAIKSGRSIHANCLKTGLLSCSSTSKLLLNVYAKTGELDDCSRLFRELGSCCFDGDPVFWNILLSGFAWNRVFDLETLRLFRSMRLSDGVKPSSVTAAIVLPVYARLGDVSKGKVVHCYLIKSALVEYTLVGNALVSMYAKCGLIIHDAYAVFNSIVDKDVVSWNAIIAGLAENKLVGEALRLFHLMLRSNVKPNCATIANIFPVIASLDGEVAYFFGRELHCYALRTNQLFEDVCAYNALVTFYLRIGEIYAAEVLFRRMGFRDMVSWNAIIAGYTSNCKWSKALESFRELLLDSDETIIPNSVTLVSVLPACAQLKRLQCGKQIHGYVLRHSCLGDDTSVGNALVSFYSKCNYIETAYQMFLSISRRDLISWNSMLDAFAGAEYNVRFLDLLNRLFMEGFKPDSITILTIVRLCTNISEVHKVKETHAYALRHNQWSRSEPTVQNAILDAYAKCGHIVHASKLFENLFEKRNLVSFNSMISGYESCGLQNEASALFSNMHANDITTWNLMIRAYAENSCPDQALGLFHELQSTGTRPDPVTIMSVLPVCSQLASCEYIKQCHGYVIRACFNDSQLEGTMLDLYAKCGCISYASKLFNSNPMKDLVMFTAMVGGYAMHGMGKEALGTFFYMLECGLKPDHVIITAALSACSHAGLVNEGLAIFDSIEKVYGMIPTMEQYSCVVDLLARGGRIDDAYYLAAQMPNEPNANVWGALLGACNTHNMVELGQTVADSLLAREEKDLGNYVALSNLYAADGKWDRVVEIRKLMDYKNFRKPAGCSWIELRWKSNVFVAGNCSHPQRIDIYSALITLDQQIKEPSCFYRQLHTLPVAMNVNF